MTQSNPSTQLKKQQGAAKLIINAEEYQERLRKWTTQSRRKTNFPRRLKGRLIAAHYFQIAFVSSETYSEPQVNTAIRRGNAFKVDHVQIRRYLVDSGMIARCADDKAFSLSEALLALADWVPVVSVTEIDS
ncbi:MAG: hypothetical protein CL879_07330 [Dehalococcoidia bacterium]|nr:hypothetical protein [Dehalococcoidia bacterium]